MKKYDFIFVIVIYKNTDDVCNLIPQIQKLNASTRVVLVDNYSNKYTREKVIRISKEYNCDLVFSENSGYGAGNNRGIEFALNHYVFSYLIVCNSDLEIIKFDTRYFKKEFQNKIIAPKLYANNGKPQNPYWFRFNRLAEFTIYHGLKDNIRLLFYFGCGLFKIERSLFLTYCQLTKKKYYKVAAAHGAFVIFSYDVLYNNGLPYDEKMFLFGEEALLAHEFGSKGIETLYTEDVEIRHFEDGTMNVSNIHELDETKKSTLYYYEKVYK